MFQDYNQLDKLHSMDAEQAILASLMKEPSAWDKIESILAADSFHYEPHRLIFKAMELLVKTNTPLGAMHLQLKLNDFGDLDKAGGFEYLLTLQEHPISTLHIMSFSHAVADMHIRRSMLSILEENAQALLAPKNKKAHELLDDCQNKLFKLASTGKAQEHPFEEEDLLKEVWSIVEANKRGENPLAVLSGFKDLDRLTSGFKDGSLVVLAARPSMGKTSLALQFALNAIYNDVPALIFSLEVPRNQITIKMLSSILNTPYDDVVHGRFKNLTRSMEQINLFKSKRFCVDDANLTINSLRTKARQYARKLEADGKKLGMIVIDYLQLLTPSSGSENRTQEVSDMSRGLKALAKELKIPVIALSQLNRSVESRNNKRPLLSDLRESGAIEQDADMVMMIYRDEYYNNSSPEKGIAEVIVTKNRNGATGTVKLHFKPEITSFKDLVYNV